MATLWQGLRFGTVLVCGLVFRVVLCDQACYDSLKINRIINDYADEVGSTDIKLCSEYTQIQCEENYAPSLLEKRPTTYFTPPKGCDYLAIMLLGKYDDTNTTVLWFEYNIPAEEMRTGFTGREGNEIVIYKAPRTCEGGPASHVLFVYCPNNGSQIEPFSGPVERNNFDIKTFAQDQNFGNPVAAIYFKVTAAGQLMKTTAYTNRAKRGGCPK